MLIVPTLPKLVLHYVNLLCQADMIGRFSKLSWSGTQKGVGKCFKINLTAQKIEVQLILHNLFAFICMEKY
jgi:hypothetical protein